MKSRVRKSRRRCNTARCRTCVTSGGGAEEQGGGGWTVDNECAGTGRERGVDSFLDGAGNVVDVERSMMSLNICRGVLDAIFGLSVLGWCGTETGLGRAYDMFASLREHGRAPWTPPTAQRRLSVWVCCPAGRAPCKTPIQLAHASLHSPVLAVLPYSLPGDFPSTAFRPPPSSSTLSPNLTFFTYTP